MCITCPTAGRRSAARSTDTGHACNASSVRHGYTNDTERIAEVVRKCYQGPESVQRAHAERVALSALEGSLPVPRLIGTAGAVMTTAFVDGAHGQDLIEAGHARQVLAECGNVLRRLHSLDPTVIEAPLRSGSVIVHGDFGPNNVLFADAGRSVVAVLDWEFCHVGPAVDDVAWCEWIVRMHHPAAVDQLAVFFDAYGDCPTWADRQSEMLRRCVELEDFARRWDPDGSAVSVWRQRAEVVANRAE